MIVASSIPITKDGKGQILSKNNYKRIAIASVFLKVFENKIINRISKYILKCNNQSGFKKYLGIKTCVCSLKYSCKVQQYK